MGAMPWGTHFCHFYETKDDLLDTLVPYFKAGLDDGEFCVWVVSEPLTAAEAWIALGRAVPDLARHVADGSIEMVSAIDWYLQGGTFDRQRVTASWDDKLARALSRGYAGVRVSGNTAWLQEQDWQEFCEYEAQINGSCPAQRMIILCTYPAAILATGEPVDVLRTHQFAVARRRGTWEIVETPQLRQARAEVSA